MNKPTTTTPALKLHETPDGPTPSAPVTVPAPVTTPAEIAAAIGAKSSRYQTTPIPCKGCGRPTLGSFGPQGVEGVYLVNVCQSCKDEADRELRVLATHGAMVASLIHKAATEPVLHEKGTDRLLSAIEKAEPAIPDGFEVREFEKGWYPCADFDNRGNHRVFNTEERLWSASLIKDWRGDFGYRTRSDAIADMPRWIEAAKRESWYAKMRRTTNPAPVVQSEPSEPEQPERFDEMTGPMPDESGASGGYGFSEKSPRYTAALGCGQWVVRDNRPGPQDPWEVAVGLGEGEARKMAEVLNSGVVRTNTVTVPKLVSALQGLRDIIHDDLTHARQRDHHEAIRAADVLLAAAKGGA